MDTFCTIITPDFLPFAKTLCQSISNKNNSCSIAILICDNRKNIPVADVSVAANISYYFLEDLMPYNQTAQIHAEYFNNNKDAFRWSMKPVFILFLLKQKRYSRVIYTDSDICFFSDPKFLFEELSTHNVIITPHWRNMFVSKETSNTEIENFESLFNSGLYNAGFLGANSESGEILDWWAKSCIYRCEKDSLKGFYVDQTYLNLFPLLSDKVGIIYHKGCNVADWNRIECKRTASNGETLINNVYPIVFIHFTSSLIKSVNNGTDSLLESYFHHYKNLFFEVNGYAMPLHEKVLLPKKNFIYNLRKRIRLRTRLKKFWKG